jgi:hypothetical protein
MYRKKRSSPYVEREETKNKKKRKDLRRVLLRYASPAGSCRPAVAIASATYTRLSPTIESPTLSISSHVRGASRPAPYTEHAEIHSVWRGTVDFVRRPGVRDPNRRDKCAVCCWSSLSTVVLRRGRDTSVPPSSKRQFYAVDTSELPRKSDGKQ